MPDRAGHGPGPRSGRDETDERIRALLARAMASAPAPPSTDELRLPSLPPARIAVSVVHAGHRPPLSGNARMLRAVAASIAVVVLAVTAALAAGGSRDAGDRTAMPGDGLPVRYVPTEVPAGLALADVDLAAEPGADPTPEVTVYDGPGGTRVRIAEGPIGWAARTAGPTPNSARPGTTPPETGAPTTTADPPTSLPSTTPTSPGTTTGPTSTGPTSTGPTSTGPTTTVPGLDAASLPSVPGVPGRPDIRATTVRGDVGGLEAHDPTTTTVWFLDRGQLVAVDVFGLDQVGALGLVERLAVGADGRLAPAPEDGLQRAAAAPAQPAGVRAPATAQLVYTAPERQGQDGGPAFVVTTSRLALGADDLLAATVGSFGRIERWGDRQVLVDDGLDGGATTLVSFVDPAGVLVTVLGPSGDLEPYVDGLVPADEELWDRVVAGAEGADR